MCPANPLPRRESRHSRRCGFTLVELLVVMGVIAVLATLTLVSVRAITKDARLSSATNTVTAALANARALAMKKNTPVLVAFYPAVQGDNESRVDIITAAWTGDSIVAAVRFPNFRADMVFDRFRPIPDVPIRSLPVGIKIAGPSYAENSDTAWMVMTDLARQGEALGQLVGVMYGADGTTLVDNPANDSDFFWVDFNNSGLLEMDQDADGEVELGENVLANPPVNLFDFLLPRNAADEVAINLVPFVAVFDDTAAREMFGDDDWIAPDSGIRQEELTDYITQFADRIHFNRYTGVAMK